MKSRLWHILRSRRRHSFENQMMCRCTFRCITFQLKTSWVGRRYSKVLHHEQLARYNRYLDGGSSLRTNVHNRCSIEHWQKSLCLISKAQKGILKGWYSANWPSTSTLDAKISNIAISKLGTSVRCFSFRVDSTMLLSEDPQFREYAKDMWE